MAAEVKKCQGHWKSGKACTYKAKYFLTEGNFCGRHYQPADQTKKAGKETHRGRIPLLEIKDGLNMVVDDPKTKVYLIRNYLQANGIDDQAYLQSLIKDVEWDLDNTIRMGIMVHKVPRGTMLVANEKVTYPGDRMRLKRVPWSDSSIEPVTQIRKLLSDDPEIEKLIGKKSEANSCLLNYYRNGDDSIAVHSDKNSLGGETAIMGVSLGTGRRFIFRQKRGERKRLSFITESGDLLIMAGKCQDEWTHEIPKQKGIEDPRVSMTFRESYFDS